MLGKETRGARILVTGGPVHAKLDAVKIVTNRFKGGRMAALADALAVLGHDVVYLCAQGSTEPLRCGVRHHEGFDDYSRLVPLWATENDVVILGAAVANLIPRPTAWSLEEKFPSHNYAPGDMVDIPFMVAPRVIDEVKKANPRCTLIGFKLLSNVSRDELTRAAYGTLREARADLVVANDTRNLNEKLLVTKERSVIPATPVEMLHAIDAMARDEHYRTEFANSHGMEVGRQEAVHHAADRCDSLAAQHGQVIRECGSTPEGLLFGCIAARVPNSEGFVCSTRGKSSLGTWVHVLRVDHLNRVVHVVGSDACGESQKATLNAPLLDRIFRNDQRVQAIVHTHKTGTKLKTYPYAPPGTVRDSQRNLDATDFEIEHHGSFFLRW